MPPQYLIIGLSQLTESLIPAYVVTLSHYQIEWHDCLTEAILAMFNSDAVLTYEYLYRVIDYSFGEALMTMVEERCLETGHDWWTAYEKVSAAFIALTWAYYQHYFNYIFETLGRYRDALDRVSVERFLEATCDVILEFEWDTTRLPESNCSIRT